VAGDQDGESIDGAASESLAGELRDARPSVDAVGMNEVRARAERVLFGAAEPARLGRFALLGPIAGGGMGVVYSAYDPQLDRRVALKLIHPHQRGTTLGRARLIGEARALARLDHPNVVPIHDVLEIDDQIVLVMELVAGQTLAAWERSRAHTWREVVAIYVEAGRGLAAVHRLGLAHRDFKPANAIVGDDGRVRVLDFGLARFADDDELAATEPAGSPLGPASPLTATGEVLGTIGFMAPEQLLGDTATAASDQFSFCVALHRALHGVPPFAGATIAELLTSIEARRIHDGSGGARTPSWLRAVIARGLATDPAARFPSMEHLLLQLERERGWRRWRGPAVAAAAVAATTVAIVALTRPPPDALAACDGGVSEIGAIWNPGRRGRIGSVLAAVDLTYARAIGGRVLGTLDGYRGAWSHQHRDACVEHRRGAQSAQVLDRRMACLRRRLGDLASAIDVIDKIDRASIGHAVDVVVGLPPVADCGDLAVLESKRDPPTTMGARAQVAALSARLSRAEALERVGRSAEALTDVVTIVADARQVDYPPALVDALLVEGRIRVSRRENDAAHTPLAAAEQLALEHGLLASAVIAGARRIYVDGIEGHALDRLLGEAAVLEPLSRGLPGDRFARPLLLNNVGVLHMSRGQRELARAAFEAARKALDGVEAPDLELTSIDENLAMLTTDPTAREALARSVWLRLRDQLGPQHLRTVQALYVYAHYIVDPAVALPLVAEACRLYREFHPELIPGRAEWTYYQALLSDQTGDEDGAAALRKEIVAFAAGSRDPEAALWSKLAAGHVALQQGDARAALVQFEKVRAEFAGGAEWWYRQRVGHALLGVGQAERALGRAHDALVHFDEAATIFLELTAINEDEENHQALAIARRAAAAIRTEHPLER
jgi:tetratricopeptide (TPR) repeat protein/predicted Ser/Thr protein kinase